MPGTPDYTQLDQECYLELWRRCSYKTNIKKVQYAIPKILQACYLGTFDVWTHPFKVYKSIQGSVLK